MGFLKTFLVSFLFSYLVSSTQKWIFCDTSPNSSHTLLSTQKMLCFIFFYLVKEDSEHIFTFSLFFRINIITTIQPTEQTHFLFILSLDCHDACLELDSQMLLYVKDSLNISRKHLFFFTFTVEHKTKQHTNTKPITDLVSLTICNSITAEHW